MVPATTAVARSKTGLSTQHPSSSVMGAACRSVTPSATDSWRCKPSDEEVARLQEYQRAFRALGALMAQDASSDQARLLALGLQGLGISKEVAADFLEHFAVNRRRGMQDFMG